MSAIKLELETVLDLQPSWVPRAPSDEMALRGLYVRGDVTDFVRAQRSLIADRLLCASEDVEIEGKDATESYSRIPWVRFANRLRSPNPREGWYAVYLFAEDGSEVALSLIQGTQLWDGVGMRSRPEAAIRARSDWARARIAEAMAGRARLSSSVRLGTGDKARAYEAGTVTAYRYPREAVPDESVLEADLLDMAQLLQLVHRAEASGPAPGDPAPEVAEAQRVATELAGRRAPRATGFRATAEQRRAVELRAMELVTSYYEELGADVQDVSANRPFDLLVTIPEGVVVTVEVKGSAGDGSEILLTRGEVDHHREAYPANALAVVSSILLDGPPDAPKASGGDLTVLPPWLIDDAAIDAPVLSLPRPG